MSMGGKPLETIDYVVWCSYGVTIGQGVYILGWSAKKNIPQNVTKFGEVVGSPCETTQKKFEPPRWRGRRAGGSQRVPSFEKNRFFFHLAKMAFDKGAI